MSAVLTALRSPAVKWAFLVVALALGAVAVTRNWDEIVVAIQQLHWPAIVGSVLASIVYIWCTMLSWRAVLRDLGSPLSVPVSVRMFGVSQIGKYIPGGVWNFLAAAELGAAHQIPRRRSVSAMAVSVLVSLMTGLALGTLAFVLSPAAALQRWEWLLVLAPILLVMLLPPVMNRVIGLLLTVTRRPALEHALTSRGLARAAGWAILGWLVAGLHIWFLAVDLGLDLSVHTWLLGTASYALAWVAGFVVVVSPAGVGVREAILAAGLAGAGLDTGQVLTLVLLSRFLLTLCDFGYAGVGLLSGRRR